MCIRDSARDIVNKELGDKMVPIAEYERNCGFSRWTISLTNVIYNMDAAYQKFFKEHAGYPKFKSKHDNHKSYTTNFR